MDSLKIVIAGIGTVGSGVLKILIENKLHIERKINKKIILSAIATRNLKKIKYKLPKETKIFKDAKEILNYSDYDVLVELIGGDEGISKKIVLNA